MLHETHHEANYASLDSVHVFAICYISYKAAVVKMHNG